LIKVINPNKKSENQTFVLRNISGAVSTLPQLREEILKQFGPELVPDDLDFPVGYTKGGNKVWIRTATDVQDVWSFIHRNESVSLWCHGVSASAPKGKRPKDFSSETDSDRRFLQVQEKTQEEEKEEVQMRRENKPS
jgi:hypothetical protein